MATHEPGELLAEIKRDFSGDGEVGSALNILSHAVKPGNPGRVTQADLEKARFLLDLKSDGKPEVRERLTRLLEEIYGDEESMMSHVTHADAALKFLESIGMRETELHRALTLHVKLSEEVGRQPLGNGKESFPHREATFPFGRKIADEFPKHADFSHINPPPEIGHYAVAWVTHEDPARRLRSLDVSAIRNYKAIVQGIAAQFSHLLAKIAHPDPARREYSPRKKVETFTVDLAHFFRHFVDFKKNRLSSTVVLRLENLPPMGDMWQKAIQAVEPDCLFHMSELLLIYHVVRGANAVVGHPERNPLNPADRRATQQDLMAIVQEQVGEFNNEQILAVFGWLFASADQFLPPPQDPPEPLPPPEALEGEAKVLEVLRFGVEMAHRSIAWLRENGLATPALEGRLEAYIAEAEGHIANPTEYDPRRAFLRHKFIAHETHFIETNPAREGEQTWPAGDHSIVYRYPVLWSVTDGEECASFSKLDTAINGMTGTLADLSLPDGDLKSFIRETVSLFASLWQFERCGKLKPTLNGSFPRFRRTKDENGDRYFDEATASVASIDVEENVLWFHVLEGIKAILVREGVEGADAWDIRKEADRRFMRISLRKAIRGLSGVTSAIKNEHVKSFEQVFSRVERLWNKPVVAIAKPDDPRDPALPPPAPSSPAATEIMLAMPSDWQRVRNFAETHFALKGRQAGIYEKKAIRELEEARTACQSKASRLPAPLDADVRLEGKTECVDIEVVHLHRPAGEAVAHLSNLICEGRVQFRSGKKGEHYTLGFRMDESGNLEIEVEGSIKKGANAFQSPSLKIFYLELQKIITMGLRDHLVRVVTGAEMLRQAEPRGPSTTETAETSATETPSRTIAPRTLADLLVLGNDGDSTEKGPFIPHGTELLARLLAKEEPITAEDLAGKNIALFQQEVIDVDVEVGRRRKQVPLEVYVPIPEEDHLRVLEEMRTRATGALDAAHIFLMRSRDGKKRLGYHRWKRKGELGVECFTQRQPEHSELEQALIAHLQKRRVGIIETGEAAELQFFVLSADPEIQQVRLRMRRSVGEMEVWEETTLLTEDLDLMKKGARLQDGLSDGAALVDVNRGILSEEVPLPGVVEGAAAAIGYRVAAVLNVPQTVQYIQGSYIPVATAISLLKTKPATPAVSS